jgi:hypothetical protein
MDLVVVPVVFATLVAGTIACVTQRRRHRSSSSANGADETVRIGTYGNTSAVRVLRSDEDLSEALERANATSVRIAAETASRRYARFAVVPLHDDAS